MRRNPRARSKPEAGKVFRIGLGFDIHRFSEKGCLVVGQVEFDFPGLEGASSDVDVLLHALSDALLGASGNPDIGTLFPPEKSKGISSKEILQKVLSLVRREYEIENADCVIIAQKPKMGGKIPEMRKNLRDLLRCDVNVKVKSPEGLGSLGRSEGISAIAVVLLRKK